MLKFSQFRKEWELYGNLIHEALNTHSTHISDMLLYSGRQGVVDAIKALKKITLDLASNRAPQVSVKIDGSPALFCGYLDHKFFVATKSLFNKTPKVNFTPSDITANHPGDLGRTLNYFLQELKAVVPDNGTIYQGDCLFIPETKQTRTIDGISCFCWQPNTILYSVAKNSELGAKIAKAKCGICFHSRYKWNGKDWSTIQLQDFGAKKEQFKPSPSVWVSDPYMLDLTKEVTFNKAQQEQLTANNREISSLLNGIDFAWVQNKDVAPLLQVYINSFFKVTTPMGEASEKASGFLKWLQEKMTIEMDSKSTEAAKARIKAKYASALDETKLGTLTNLFKTWSLLEQSKLIVKALIDKISVSNNFLVKTDGTLVATGNEGYVIVQGAGTGSKIVSRGEFSAANFGSSFLKRMGTLRENLHVIIH